MLKTLLGGQPINALVIGGISMAVAGLCVLLVRSVFVAVKATRVARVARG